MLYNCHMLLFTLLTQMQVSDMLEKYKKMPLSSNKKINEIKVTIEQMEDFYGELITELEKKYKVPRELIYAIKLQESGDYLFVTGRYCYVGAHGELGIMQILPSTYNYLKKKYNLKYDVVELCFDEVSLEVGTILIKDILEQYNNLYDLISIYNCGNTYHKCKNNKITNKYIKDVLSPNGILHTITKIINR